MRFLVPLNEAQEGESVTVHAIETGSTNKRTNKKILRQYFKKMGVPTYRIKFVMKQMGFIGDSLGILPHEAAASTTPTQRTR